jgi:hypothetical protein
MRIGPDIYRVESTDFPRSGRAAISKSQVLLLFLFLLCRIIIVWRHFDLQNHFTASLI